MDRPKTDPESLSKAVAEWTMLANVLHGMISTPTVEVELEDEELVPVTILSGFLGSGKTTVLKRLLTDAQGLRISAIVNDFGAINLDAEDIEKVHDDVIELTNGCSCCQVGGDLSKSLSKVASAHPAPDHIVVEASGVSEPFSLALIASMCPETRTEGVVTLVDAEAFDAYPSDLLEDATFRRQIEVAHVLVLSKTDRLPGDRIPEVVKTLERNAPGRMVIDSSSTALNRLLLQGADKLGARLEPDQVHHDVHRFETTSVLVHEPVSQDALVERLRSIPAGLLRLKGRLPAAGGGALDVQCVDTRFAVHREDDPIEDGFLVAIGKREGGDEWLPWTSALFAWLQSRPRAGDPSLPAVGNS